MVEKQLGEDIDPVMQGIMGGSHGMVEEKSQGTMMTL